MRVLYVNHTSEMSGAEHSLLGLISALPPGIAVMLACPDGLLARRAEERGITVTRLRGIGGRPRLGLASLRAMRQVVTDGVRILRVSRRGGFDLVHTNSMRSGVVCCLARWMGGVPVVAHVRDCYPPREPLTRLARALVAFSATGIIFNSRFTMNCFLEGIERVAQRSDRRVIGNGVELEVFTRRVTREQARKELGLGQDQILLGIIAQMTPWKGHEDAIRAFEVVLNSGHDAHLVLVGTVKFVSAQGRYDHREYAMGLRRLVEHLGLLDRVTFMGETDDVPLVLTALDVVLVPSLREPFGRVVIEAMAMGRPVLATAVGGPAEILEGGCGGLLLPPGRPELWGRTLDDLLRHRSRLIEMGVRGRERVIERHNITHHAALVAEAYAAALRPAGMAAN